MFTSLKILSLVGVLTGTPAFAQSTTGAAPPSAWTFTPSARSRYEQGSRYNLYDGKDYTTLRLRALVTYAGFERVKIVAEPQYNKIWGAEPYVGSGAAANDAQSTSGNTAYPGTMDEINLRSAYLDWALAPGLNAMIGRQVLLYGDQQILGPADWGPYSRSFDALRLRYVWRDLTVDGLHAKVVDTQTSKVNLGDDKNLDGVYATYAANTWLKTIDAYHFWLRDNERLNDAKARTEDKKYGPALYMYGTYGVRAVLGVGSLAGKVEYAKNFGAPELGTPESGKYNGMLIARADYQFTGRFTQKFGLEIYHAGENWRELYPTPFEAMGRTDVLGRRNVEGGAVHWVGTWGERWVTTVDALYFRRVGEGTTVFQPDGRTVVGKTGLTSTELGEEVDVTARFALTKQVSLSGGYAVLFPGAYLNDSVTNSLKPPTYLYAMIELRQ